MRRTCFLAVGAAAVALVVAGAPVSGISADDAALYTVENGKVDPDTYDGYIVYTRMCQACHGPDGLGSSFAPSLVQAAERRTFEEFAQTIAEGREIQPGQVMPSFADDPYVMSNISHIWSYLNARADGELGRGRPRIIEEMQDEADD